MSDSGASRERPSHERQLQLEEKKMMTAQDRNGDSMLRTKSEDVDGCLLNRRNMLFAGTTFAAALAVGSAASAHTARAQQQAPAGPGGRKPNIIMIMGDDVGMWNISAYNRGMMGGRTPNLDRIAAEGAVFTDYYAQQSCTAGRAAFILGQTPFRTGLLKVGLPAAKQGLQD